MKFIYYVVVFIGLLFALVAATVFVGFLLETFVEVVGM